MVTPSPTGGEVPSTGGGSGIIGAVTAAANRRHTPCPAWVPPAPDDFPLLVASRNSRLSPVVTPFPALLPSSKKFFPYWVLAAIVLI